MYVCVVCVCVCMKAQLAKVPPPPWWMNCEQTEPMGRGLNEISLNSVRLVVIQEIFRDRLKRIEMKYFHNFINSMECTCIQW